MFNRINQGYHCRGMSNRITIGNLLIYRLQIYIQRYELGKLVSSSICLLGRHAIYETEKRVSEE